MNNQWQPTGKINPQELTESRLQLHYGVQFIAATGSALAAPKPDYSHTTLGWNTQLKAFVGEPIKANKTFSVALEPVSLTAFFIDEQNNQIAQLSLHQQTLEQAMNWHRQEIAKLGAADEKVVFIDYPPDDFPDHEIARGKPFDASSSAVGRQELANYYANTNLLLQAIVAEYKEASPVHIWPHHFDIATLITLSDNHSQAEHGNEGGEMTIGVGMSPGDKSYDEPYWYVTPWPYPDTTNLPQLDGEGFWHTQHWVGAVLKASQLTQDSASAQAKQVRLFLDSAVKASKALLEAEG